MDLSEDETSESESESSMLDGYDDDDDRLSDDHNLAGAGAGAGGGGGEQNSTSFQDHTPPVHQLGRSGGGGGSGLGGASLRDHGDRDRDEDGDIDFLKRRARELQSVLHSQETHFSDGAAGGSVGGSNRATGGGASFMPKLDLADPGGAGGGGERGRVRRRWDDHPSATGLGGVHQRHSLPLLSPNQASG